MSEWTLKTDSTGQLTITVEGEEWEKAVEKAFKKISQEVEIPGFRKGKAPKNLLLKRLNMQSVYYEAFEKNIDKWFADAIQEHDVRVATQPKMLQTPALSQSKAVVTIDIEVFPEGKVADYSGIKYVVEEPVVTDEMLDNEMQSLRKKYAEIEEIDGAAEQNDTVNIDYEGFIDGVSFEGGKAEAYDLVLGSKSFIPGFEDQLVGACAGDEKEVVVTFPEDYHEKSIAGKEATFKVKVNNVKREMIPEVDDDFAEDVNFPNVSTVDELKEYLKGTIADKLKDRLVQEADAKLVADVAALCENELSDEIITERAKEMLNDSFANIQNMGLSVSQYMQMVGMKPEEMLDRMKDDAEQSLKYELAVEAIGKAEGFSVTDEEANEYLEKSASEYQMNAEDLKGQIDMNGLKREVIRNKVVEFLKGLNVAEGTEAE